MIKITKLFLSGLFLLAIGACAGCIWFSQWQEDVQQNELEAAYQYFLPETSATITNQYYEKQAIFTNSVARFRFDGADETLVASIVDKYDLTISTERARSDFPTPSWWQLPVNGMYYLHGTGHAYRMLVYDPANGRIFFEVTQD